MFSGFYSLGYFIKALDVISFLCFFSKIFCCCLSPERFFSYSFIKTLIKLHHGIQNSTYLEHSFIVAKEIPTNGFFGRSNICVKNLDHDFLPLRYFCDFCFTFFIVSTESRHFNPPLVILD